MAIRLEPQCRRDFEDQPVNQSRRLIIVSEGGRKRAVRDRIRKFPERHSAVTAMGGRNTKPATVRGLPEKPDGSSSCRDAAWNDGAAFRAGLNLDHLTRPERAGEGSLDGDALDGRPDRTERNEYSHRAARWRTPRSPPRSRTRRTPRIDPRRSANLDEWISKRPCCGKSAKQSIALR
jgi:hypothetical protein